MVSPFSFSDNTVGFILEERFTEDVVDLITAEVEKKWKTHERINLYLEDANITSFALGAIFKKIGFKLANSDRFSKMALVTDRKWLQACAALEDVFTTADVRSYATEDRVHALAWIAQ